MKSLPKFGAIEMLSPNSMTTISTKSWLISVGARRPRYRESWIAGNLGQLRLTELSKFQAGWYTDDESEFLESDS